MTSFCHQPRNKFFVPTFLLLGLIGVLFNRLTMTKVAVFRSISKSSISHTNASSSTNTTGSNHGDWNETTRINAQNHLLPDDPRPIFSWDYLDLTQPIFCGSDKCLFRSNTNATTEIAAATATTSSLSYRFQQLHHEGYLVQTGKYFESVFDGHAIAHYLATTFGITHYLLEPPIATSIDRFTAQKIFQNYSENPNKYHYWFPPTPIVPSNQTKVKAAAATTATATIQHAHTVVQKITIAPTKWYVYELRKNDSKEKIFEKLENLTQALFEFHGYTEDSNISALAHPRNEASSAAATLSSFYETLETELQTTHDLLRCEPLLALDFQIMVDIFGKIHHLDFDRVLSNGGGLIKYNQTKFDAKVQSNLYESNTMLFHVLQWIHTQRNNSATTTIPQWNNSTSSAVCPNQDWRAEETAVLSSTSLPCLATERVAIARHKTTSTLESRGPSSNATTSSSKQIRIRHPLLVALLRRVINAGMYGPNTTDWDCNVYGDRVLPTPTG